MKKFGITAAIILILAALAFFGGWVQPFIPIGSVAVLQSKTHGVEEVVMRGGKFNWVWYKLIPGNVKTYIFELANSSFSVDEEGTLPMADVYKELTGLRSDFSWRISGSFDWMLNEEALPRIIAQNGITGQDALDSYTEKLSGDIQNYVKQRINSYFLNEESENVKAVFADASKEGSIPSLSRDIQNAFPQISVNSCNVLIKKMPDFALYESSKALYKDYISTQQRVLQSEVENNAGRYITSEFRLNELTKYGEILTKYPILIDNLSIESKKSDSR